MNVPPARGVDPRVDIVFKAIFGDPRHAHILIHLLNAILNLRGKRRIISVKHQNPIQDREKEDEKMSIVDVLVRDQSGHSYQIDVQIKKHQGLNNRMLLYSSRTYSRQLSKGESYVDLKPTVGIWFCGFVLDDDEPCITRYLLKSETTHKVLSDQLQICVVQLPKAILEDTLDKSTFNWCTFLEKGEELDMSQLPSQFDETVFQDAADIAQNFAESGPGYYNYLRRQKALELQATLEVERDQAVLELNRALDKLDKAFDERNQALNQVKQRDEALEAKDHELESKTHELEAKDQQIKELMRQLQNRKPND